MQLLEKCSQLELELDQIIRKHSEFVSEHEELSMSLVDRVSADLGDAVRSVQEERDGALALNALMEDEMKQRRGWTAEVCAQRGIVEVCEESVPYTCHLLILCFAVNMLSFEHNCLSQHRGLFCSRLDAQQFMCNRGVYTYRSHHLAWLVSGSHCVLLQL